MYTIVLFAFLVFVIIVICSPNDEMKIPICLIAIVVSALIGSLIAVGISLFAPTTTVEYSPSIFVGMQTHENLQGSFTLGTGVVDSKLVYCIYAKNDDGSVTPTYIAADSNTRIVEDNTLHHEGQWITYDEVYKSPWNHWALNPDSMTSVIAETQELRVPPGSVITSFSAN